MSVPARIGRYLVMRPLGHGGMGQVFLAEDPTLERRVALKLLHRDPSNAGLREEAKALAALRHPSIVTIYEIGDHEGQDFIAMEYLPGKTLRQLLEDGASRAALLEICAKVALAVEAAHHAGILHRDIKPENILVGDTGEVKVVDFGIARRLGHRPHRRAATAQEVVDALLATMPITTGTDTIVSAGTQTVFGTPAYMAPETLSGEASTEASDVYSLGVVVHECLAGRRPYSASSLVEMIAQVIDSAPPRLDDPLADLVEAMLAPAPGARPSLADVVARLRPARAATPAVARPDRRWLIAALAGALVLAVSVGTWRYVREPAAARAVIAAPIVAKIAVAPIVVDVLSYGAEKPSADNLADALAQTLAKVKGAQLTGIALKGQTAADAESATRVGAHHLVVARITEAGGVLRASAEVLEIASGRRTTLDVTSPAPLLAPLLDALTIQVARVIAPDATFDRAPDRMLAERLYQQGKPLLDASRFRLAWTYLEQAVDVDPTFFDAWYALTFVLAWQEAPEEVVAHATREALRLAPPGPKRSLMQGVALFLDGRFGEARVELERLEQANVADDRRELFYFLGEATWHDGRHAAAYAYFKRALDADREFRPATIHMSQYTLARRDNEASRFIVGISGENYEAIDFAAGNYDALATTGSPAFQVPARLVLGLPVSPALEDAAFGHGLDRASYAIARALEVGDRDAARAEFAAAWKRDVAGRDLPSHMYYALELLGEVVIAGGLTDEARTLVTFLAERSAVRPKRGYQRLSILAAPLLGDASLIVRTEATHRNTRLAEAMTAEIAGDDATAAAILTELVGDPSFTWDYPERAALLRSLRALRRPREIAALCKDTLRPAVFRLSYLVLRGACRPPAPGR